MPKLIQNSSRGPLNGIIGGQNASDGAKWTLGAPRCAQREVKVRQDGCKKAPRSPWGPPEEPLGPPEGPQGAQEGPG